MEVYARVRRSVQVDRMSERQAAREYGLSRKTIRKMMAYSAPPGYQRRKPVARLKLGPWLGVVDQILEDDESRFAARSAIGLVTLKFAPLRWRPRSNWRTTGQDALAGSPECRSGPVYDQPGFLPPMRLKPV